ncbi:PAS domain S-box protein [Sunxiuqinia sp. A32]|uniref:PAS domain S-box protein n=1 Tax=Sunxiuqinia sp. A32 TaxID=3461496 RepID=UPI004045C649
MDKAITQLSDNDSNQRFRDLFEHIAIGLTICNTKGEFLNVNEPFCKLMGYTRAELLTMSFADITHPDDLASDLALVQQLLDGEIDNYKLEKRYKRKDNSDVWVNLSVSLVRDKNDKPHLFFGTIEDISLRKETELELEQTKQDWKNIFQAINHPTALLDKNHTIVDINDAIVKSSGKAREEIIGSSCYKIFHGDKADCPSNGCPMQTLLKSGKAETFEMEMKAFNGTFLVSCTPMYDEKGELKNIIHIATDITYLKQIEQALTESESRYRILLDSAPVGIAVHCEGKVVFTNQAALKMFKADAPEDLIGKTITDIIHPSTLSSTMELINRIMKGEKGLSPAVDKYICKDGSVIDVNVYASSIVYKGKPAVQVVVMDLTETKKIKDRLLEWERRFSNIMKSVNLVSIILDTKANITFCNQYFLDLTGYKYEEVIGKNWFELFIPSEINTEVKAIFAEAVKNDNLTANYENEIQTKEGKKISISWTNTLLKDFNNEVIGAASIGDNVTEKKKATEELKISEEKFSKLFQSSPDAIMLTRLSDGVITEINESVVKLTGYTKEELIGHSSITLNLWLDPKQRDIYAEHLQKKQRINNFEASFRMKSGEIKVGMISGEIIQIQNETYILGIIRDITEIKKSILEIESSEEKFSKLFQSSPDAITLTKKSDRLIADVNQSACDITGYSREELIGQPILSLKFWKNEKELIQYATLLQKYNRVTNFEAEFKMKSGDVKIGLVSGETIHLHDGDYVIGIIRDITIRKKSEQEIIKRNTEYAVINEELTESLGRIQKINSELSIAKMKAEESDRLKTAFLQNMSHEIRTPLNAIMGFSELLPDSFDDKKTLNYFTTIINQRGNDLLEIINDILDIAKIESGQMTLNEKECNLRYFFSDIETFFSEYRARMNKSNVGFSMNVQCSNRDVIVFVDSGKLKQILMNLIINAFKFTISGMVELGCSVEDNSQLSFYVRDTGIGIPKEKQSEIFDRFKQVTVDRSKIYGGTGLGLSIVKGLLNLLGGEIWLESEPNKGSTFYFTIPFKINS